MGDESRNTTTSIGLRNTSVEEIFGFSLSTNLQFFLLLFDIKNYSLITH